MCQSSSEFNDFQWRRGSFTNSECVCVYLCVSSRQSALERALSEKDSAIARLEVDGAKSQVEIEHLEQCRLFRNKLNDQLKVEVSDKRFFS